MLLALCARLPSAYTKPDDKRLYTKPDMPFYMHGQVEPNAGHEQGTVCYSWPGSLP